MSVPELDDYARDGKLPDWFTKTIGGELATLNSGSGQNSKR
jgi:hypothetical protein